MKKKVLSVLLASTMVMSMAACGEQKTEAPATTDTAATDTTTVAEPADDTAEPAEVSELTDGKFAETRHITVEFMTVEMTADQILQTTCIQSISRRVCSRITT